MSGSTTHRLHQRRRGLVLLFTALTAAGSAVLGGFVIRLDAQLGEQRLDGELRRVTSTVTRLVKYDGSLVTAYVNQDELNTRCPQFAILPGGAERFTGHFSQQICVPVNPDRLAWLAAEAVRTGRLLNAYVTGSNGELVRVGVEPFRNSHGQYIGAVVAAADAGPERSRHNRTILFVITGCVLLVAAVAAAGHLLAGWAFRPAVAALDQQEVLLADTAHDLRTPVAALRALAETALENPTQRADLLPRTVQLAGRMGSTIDALLVRARLAAGVEQLAIQPVWLDQLVSTVVEETPTEAAQVTVTAAPTKVDVDPGLVQRAIGNLLDNALRHGRRPGDIAVVHITVAGGRVMVADHGPGIDPAMAQESFGRFNSGSGSSGLGLSIVRWVAQAHGGMLRVYNAQEGGAIFELVLPTSVS